MFFLFGFSWIIVDDPTNARPLALPGARNRNQTMPQIGEVPEIFPERDARKTGKNRFKAASGIDFVTILYEN